MPKEFPPGTFGVPCALLIGKRTESTDRKTTLNDVLRTFNCRCEAGWHVRCRRGLQRM
jgi:hypothetical protein